MAHVEDLYQPHRRYFRKRLNLYYDQHIRPKFLLAVSHSSSSSLLARPLEAILESALHSLGTCQDLIRPAGLYSSYVPKNDWVKALDTLVHSISELRNACDPDRPIPPDMWGKPLFTDQD